MNRSTAARREAGGVAAAGRFIGPGRYFFIVAWTAVVRWAGCSPNRVSLVRSREADEGVGRGRGGPPYNYQSR
jgi:hypothetical protein